MFQKYIYHLTFIIAVITMSLAYGYLHKVSLPPHGAHNWRQCDSGQFAYNYYAESMNFFEPRLSCCLGNDGKMAAEFPILYYLAAILYKIFGFHDIFLRLINLIIFYTGLFYLFKCISLFLDNKYYGLILSLMIFTSTVLIDYANNYIPDVPALSFVFMGMYYFLNFQITGKANNLLLSTLLFTLAGLLKITSLMPYLAIVGVLFFAFVFKPAEYNNQLWRSNKIHIICFILLPLAIQTLWVMYIRNYNQLNHNGYFLMDIKPYWRLDQQAIANVQGMYTYFWRWQFIYQDLLNVLPFIFLVAVLLPFRKNVTTVLWLTTLILLGSVYVALFFAQFGVHDYYLICLLPIPVGILCVFLYKLKAWKPLYFESPVIKIAVAVLLVIMFCDGYSRNAEKQSRANKQDYEGFDVYKTVLAQAGVAKNDKIMSVGDYTTGISLYLLEKRGLTGFAFPSLTVDNAVLSECITRDIKYVVAIGDKDKFITNDARELYLHNAVADTLGIKVYKL